MNVKPIISRIFAALLFSALARPALAENARLPYHELYNIQKAQLGWNFTHSNLLVVMIMQSTLPGVKTSDLSVYIDSRTGKIPVAIRAAGNFTVPMRDDLLAEDPWIITNQRKGTMRLNWQVGLIPGSITKSIRYGRLMRPLRESEDIQEQMRKFFPGSPKMVVSGLKLTFTPAQKGAVIVIHARGGDRKLTVNEHGEIILPLSSELLEEDPELSLSDMPGAVEIVSQEPKD